MDKNNEKSHTLVSFYDSCRLIWQEIVDFSNFNQNLNYTIMKKNMGNKDKTIRTILAAIIAIIYFTGVAEGTLALVLLIIAIIFAITSLINFCPLYKLVGVNTCKVKGK